RVWRTSGSPSLLAPVIRKSVDSGGPNYNWFNPTQQYYRFQTIADDSLASVVLGTGKMLSDFKLLRKISIE
ncbi:MAG: hypothetical protein LAO76_23755, partial [Acidobacteriia bacterium]|nr:hypothetical protein [Terriglobia bacterium]